ncbi:MAG: GNAT family N-acetyltransferase [Spirochaetaceae bacterium]|jgi:putative acetyltransferase|nr:GNAT family N-acetyltransferase [Spirochaetaceae bacterium]
MKFTLREIRKEDNYAVEKVIRSCLLEFGANHEGTAWTDPNLGRFSEVYSLSGTKYWVVTDERAEIIGGGGIGRLDGEEGVCELQKMYFLPQGRGKGVAQNLLNAALDFAKKHYSRCYLETLENMTAAQRFYEKNGFVRIGEALGNTQHFACDVRYIKDLH